MGKMVQFGAVAAPARHERFERGSAALLQALVISCCLAGCTTTTTSVTDDAASAAAPAANEIEYKEVAHEGRIYVTGTAASAAAFAETHHLPYTRTFIGEGPNGETVVVEVDKKDDSLADSLWEQFREKNLFYAEEMHDGRIYIIGLPATLESFKQSHHLPYTRTLVGAGPDGETLVFELDRKDPQLSQRLQAEFSRRHNISF